MLAQSTLTSLRHWPVFLFSRGAFQINVKVDLRIFIDLVFIDGD